MDGIIIGIIAGIICVVIIIIVIIVIVCKKKKKKEIKIRNTTGPILEEEEQDTYKENLIDNEDDDNDKGSQQDSGGNLKDQFQYIERFFRRPPFDLQICEPDQKPPTVGTALRPGGIQMSAARAWNLFRFGGNPGNRFFGGNFDLTSALDTDRGPC